MKLLNSKNKKTQAKQYIQRAINRDDCELEFVYGSNPRNGYIKRDDFIRMLNEFKQKYELISEDNTLDITCDNKNSLSNVRFTISGINDIKKYCKTDDLVGIANVLFLKKHHYKDSHFPSIKFTPVVDYEYNYRINLKTEQKLTESNTEVQGILMDWNNRLKMFRYKKRYSFITPDKLFRIDLTILKMNEFDREKRRFKLFKNFLDSKILSNMEKYELEIEYIGSHLNNDKTTIDEYIKKIYVEKEEFDKKQKEIFEEMGNGLSEKYEKMFGDNAYSGNTFTPIDTELYPEPDEGYNFGGAYEFDEEIKPYVVPENRKTAFMKSSFQDIKYEYWLESNRLWLFETMLTYNKTLNYLGQKDNTEGDYKNSPKNSSYIEYEIHPKYTDDELMNEDEFPDDFNNIIMVPIDDVVTITSYKKTPSWGPKPKKIKGIYYEGDHEILPTYSPESPRLLPEEIEEQDIYDSTYAPESPRLLPEEIEEQDIYDSTYAPGSPRLLPEELKSGTSSNPGTPRDPPPFLEDDPRVKKWIQEPRTDAPDVKPLMFDDLVEMGEFEDWELEIAYNSRKKNFDKDNRITDNFVLDNVLQIFINNITDILKIKEGKNILIPQSEKQTVIDDYKLMTQQETDRPRFMGPNPVSMSIENIIPDRKYSIVESYVVTEKADGIRAQLFINKDKIGYLITQKMEIIGTNIKFNNIQGNWLFDGEYITKNKNGDPIELFMIFDVYYADYGSSIYPSVAYGYPWLSKKKKDICRYSIIQDFKTKIEIDSDESDLRINFKNYLEGPRKLQKSKKDPTKYSNINGIFKQSKKILDIESKKDGYEYSIDGLIFMPMFMAVRSMDEGFKYESIDGNWTINYKWKPPEENTIDFKVRIVKEDTKKGRKDKITSSIVKGKTVICKQVYLYNGYNPRDDEDSDFNWKILTSQGYDIFNEKLFDPEKGKVLYKCNIPIKDNKMLCIKDNSEIIDNCIVEMRYNSDSIGDMRWTPLRVRSDKKYPNKTTTANSVWETITNPVKYEYITGSENIYKISSSEKIEEINKEKGYYVETDFENKDDEPLRKLHNYIKQKLIGSICSVGNKPISIMDTSMGRGGDIGKYLNSKNRINFIFGLDISPDINKAAKRYYLEKKFKPKYSMFIQYDTSESLKEGWGYGGSDDQIKNNKILIDILYDKNKEIPEEYLKINKIYSGLANKGFDIISSQFTVHYYFKNEMTLRGYLQNLSDNCKKGGYFIGTCYDGKKVFELLKENPVFEMNDEFDNKVFSITKNYDIESFELNKSNIKSLFDQKIEVYMNSIGQKITEYLVNFDLFEYIMKEYRFKLVSPELKGSYSGIFNKEKYYSKEGLGSFEKIIENLQSLSSKDLLLKENNRDLKIKKGPYCDALKINILKNEKLKKLSSLNNWFIFQKY